MIIKNHLHNKGFAPGLVVKQRLAASRKWPIEQLQILDFYFDILLNEYSNGIIAKNKRRLISRYCDFSC